MSAVFLNAWFSLETLATDPPLLDFPYYRRMTVLQKAVLQCFAKFASINPVWMQRMRIAHAPLFYSSSYGEVSAMMEISKAILHRDLPISPKEFQHSVQSAALAYLAMSQDLHHPCYALGGGHLGGDYSLYLAAQRLRVRLDSVALVINAHEFFEGGRAQKAKAEVLLLSASSSMDAFELNECLLNPNSIPNSAPLTHVDEGDPQAPNWLLSADGPMQNRCARSSQGETIVTRWHQC